MLCVPSQASQQSEGCYYFPVLQTDGENGVTEVKLLVQNNAAREKRYIEISISNFTLIANSTGISTVT